MDFPTSMPGEDFINSWYPILIALIGGVIYGIRYAVTVPASARVALSYLLRTTTSFNRRAIIKDRRKFSCLGGRERRPST